MYYGVKVAVGQTNGNIFDLLDLARRQLDHLGRDGIAAKKRQKNRRYSRKGFLRFPLRSQGQVRKVLRRINRLGEPAIQVKRFSNPNPYPF